MPCLARVLGSHRQRSHRGRAGGSAGVGQRECLAQLLSGPICGRVGGHIEVQDATPVMGQHQKYVKDLEPMVGTVKKSIETSCWAWFSRKVRQV